MYKNQNKVCQEYQDTASLVIKQNLQSVQIRNEETTIFIKKEHLNIKLHNRQQNQDIFHE